MSLHFLGFNFGKNIFPDSCFSQIARHLIVVLKGKSSKGQYYLTIQARNLFTLSGQRSKEVSAAGGKMGPNE